MCNGGRILHHFKHRLWNSKNSVIFVGYQAKGTLGRKIVEGAEEIKIFGENIAVKSSIFTINGFSAHADQMELIEWISSIEGLKKIFIVHSEDEKAERFQEMANKYLGILPVIVQYGKKNVF